MARRLTAPRSGTIVPDPCPAPPLHVLRLYMEEFRAFIRILTVASLGLAAVQIYLTLNKLWTRRHEKVVAESISIYGEFLGLIPLFFLTVSFLLDGSWEGVVDGVIWMFAGSVTIAIGAGLWVEGKRGRSFLTLVREALALERSEVGELAKAFFKPSGAGQILEILSQIALVDEDLDDRERSFIQTFADAWGIPVDWDSIAARAGRERIDPVRLRTAVESYLATSPPSGQVEQLGDVLVALVNADEQVTPEEELILAEVGGMLEAYVDGTSAAARYAVAMVPQTDEQERAIRAVLPELRPEQVAGGSAYVVGRYFSGRFAEVVSERYRSLNVFTTVLRLG